MFLYNAPMDATMTIGAQMDEFMNEFMEAMKEVFPQLLVQFEDFSTDNAFRYLDMFRNKYRCFNDDVCDTFSSR